MDYQRYEQEWYKSESVEGHHGVRLLRVKLRVGQAVGLGGSGGGWRVGFGRGAGGGSVGVKGHEFDDSYGGIDGAVEGLERKGLCLGGGFTVRD